MQPGHSHDAKDASRSHAGRGRCHELSNARQWAMEKRQVVLPWPGPGSVVAWLVCMQLARTSQRHSCLSAVWPHPNCAGKWSSPWTRTVHNVLDTWLSVISEWCNTRLLNSLHAGEGSHGGVKQPKILLTICLLLVKRILEMHSNILPLVRC